MNLSVIIPTHNPEPGRLRRTLEGLSRQTLAPDRWEVVVVDNASEPPVAVDLASFRRGRVVREPALGLTAARRCGLNATDAPLIVFVDDDNVLAPDYLQHVQALFSEHPGIGALGGRSVPEFAARPGAWHEEFFPLLALRDLGDRPQVSAAGPSVREYPTCAPIGAGMAVRRAAIADWLRAPAASYLSDRRGGALTSAGDNDIVLSVVHAGWQVAYFPELVLTHLIPESRLAPEYLARLNRGIQQTWMRVLTLHGVNPWQPIRRWTLPVRQAKAWWTYRAWSGPSAHIRWQGACGHFEGRVSGS